MKIVIGADHAGFELKDKIGNWLKELQHEIKDVGTFNSESVDYPDIAKNVALEVSSGNFERGILVCGSGIGVAISANKIKGIRAAHCHDTVLARLSREHNNANVLTLGSRFIAFELSKEIIEVWLKTDFNEGRHSKRVNKISELST